MRDAERDSFGLEDWLGVATDGLVPGTRVRVRRELAAHFNDEVEQSARQGMAAEEAHRLALRNLGWPDRVNRQLRRACLTEKDVDAIRRDLRRYHRNRSAVDMANSIALGAGFLLFLFLQANELAARLAPTLALGVGISLASIFTIRLIRRVERKARIQNFYAWRMIGVVYPAMLGAIPASIAAYWFYAYFHYHYLPAMSAIGGGAGLFARVLPWWLAWAMGLWALLLVPRWRFYRKLRRAVANGEYPGDIAVGDYGL